MRIHRFEVADVADVAPARFNGWRQACGDDYRRGIRLQNRLSGSGEHGDIIGGPRIRAAPGVAQIGLVPDLIVVEEVAVARGECLAESRKVREGARWGGSRQIIFVAVILRPGGRIHQDDDRLKFGLFAQRFRQLIPAAPIVFALLRLDFIPIAKLPNPGEVRGADALQRNRQFSGIVLEQLNVDARSLGGKGEILI